MIAGAHALPEAPEGFSWQLDGGGHLFLMDRAKNADRARAWRAAQAAKRGPAYWQAEIDRRWRAAMTERAS